MAYVIGEAYAEMYLRTLPHNSLETVVYVYGWVATVHLLDALTGWVLGIREGERVGSYPLSWVFKLYDAVPASLETCMAKLTMAWQVLYANVPDVRAGAVCTAAFAVAVHHPPGAVVDGAGGDDAADDDTDLSPRADAAGA